MVYVVKVRCRDPSEVVKPRWTTPLRPRPLPGHMSSFGDALPPVRNSTCSSLERADLINVRLKTETNSIMTFCLLCFSAKQIKMLLSDLITFLGHFDNNFKDHSKGVIICLFSSLFLKDDSIMSLTLCYLCCCWPPDESLPFKAFPKDLTFHSPFKSHFRSFSF